MSTRNKLPVRALLSTLIEQYPKALFLYGAMRNCRPN